MYMWPTQMRVISIDGSRQKELLIWNGIIQKHAWNEYELMVNWKRVRGIDLEMVFVWITWISLWCKFLLHVFFASRGDMSRAEEMYLTSETKEKWMKSEKRAGGECLKKGVWRIFQKNQIPWKGKKREGSENRRNVYKSHLFAQSRGCGDLRDQTHHMHAHGLHDPPSNHVYKTFKEKNFQFVYQEMVIGPLGPFPTTGVDLGLRVFSCFFYLQNKASSSFFFFLILCIKLHFKCSFIFI